MRGEWIEIISLSPFRQRHASLPMRGEWIEMLYDNLIHQHINVSPHAGRVD